MPRNNQWLDEEMILTLAFYKFVKNPDDKKKIKIFTERMNKLTGLNRTPSAIDLRVANYKYIDPNYHGKGMSGGGKRVEEFFEKYVIDDPSLEKLATVYSNFLNEFSIKDLLTVKLKSGDSPLSKTKVVSTVVYNRSEKVKEATLNRAVGICELCKQKAPFKTIEGKPYLEVHHVVALSDNGVDNTGNTLALCPNCHRRLHYGGALTSAEEKIIENILVKALLEVE